MTLTVGWIRAEHFHEEAATLDFLDCFLHTFFFHVPLDIDEKNVFPSFPTRRTRFDLRHIQPMGGERSEQVIQGTDLVLHRKHQYVLSLPVRSGGFCER